MLIVYLICVKSCLGFFTCVFYLSLFILGLDVQSYVLGYDFLPQLPAVFPVKKPPVGSSAQGVRSSPLGNVPVGSPVKEEQQHPEIDTKKINLGKQDSKEALKQVCSANSC